MNYVTCMNRFLLSLGLLGILGLHGMVLAQSSSGGPRYEEVVAWMKQYAPHTLCESDQVDWDKKERDEREFVKKFRSYDHLLKDLLAWGRSQQHDSLQGYVPATCWPPLMKVVDGAQIVEFFRMNLDKKEIPSPHYALDTLANHLFYELTKTSQGKNLLKEGTFRRDLQELLFANYQEHNSALLVYGVWLGDGRAVQKAQQCLADFPSSQKLSLAQAQQVLAGNCAGYSPIPKDTEESVRITTMAEDGLMLARTAVAEFHQEPWAVAIRKPTRSSPLSTGKLLAGKATRPPL